ncbi:uncharacterized protein [Nicotiana sylvestris]|uniref:uncharacterized protein n=1 Tax=Nicotiana sylvestris TaxID=4096 RepID=UPI00388CD7DE
MFVRANKETLEVFATIVGKIQVKMELKEARIRSDHRTEFDNAKIDEFCNENGITHNFSAPRTSQQNSIVKRKNRTLEDMARTMLIDNKEIGEDNATSSSTFQEEPGTSITTIEAEETVGDVVQGKELLEWLTCHDQVLSLGHKEAKLSGSFNN